MWHDTKEQWTIIDNRIHDVAVKERNKVREMRSKGIDENSALYLDARKELIFKELEKQNVENGFWIACTNPVAARKAITGKISLTNNTTVFAMSDGLARLITHFDVYRGFTDVINEIKTNGAQKVFELLRELESKKENFKKPISSTHDDASFLLIDIEPNKD